MLRAVAQYQQLVADRQHGGAMRDQDDDRAARPWRHELPGAVLLPHRRQDWRSVHRARSETARRIMPEPVPPADAARPTRLRQPLQCGCHSRSAAAKSSHVRPPPAPPEQQRCHRARPPCGLCSRQPCRRIDQRLAKDTLCSGPMISGGQCSSAAPSTRTVPRTGRHTPTSARAKRSLAGSARPDDAHDFAGGQLKAYVADDRSLAVCSHDSNIFRHQLTAWLGQCRPDRITCRAERAHASICQYCRAPQQSRASSQ